MEILIIEDEIHAAERLTRMIREIDDSISVLAILDSVVESVSWLRKNESPDLILADIHLADGLSFEVFELVNINCPIIFITAYDEYALQSFETFSIDYLLKPLDINKLTKSIEKYKRLFSGRDSSQKNNDLKKYIDMLVNIKTKYRTRFLINRNDSSLIVKADQVAYMYSEEKITFIVNNEGKKFMVDESLDNIVETLDPQSFFRANRQLIVSIGSIYTINNYFNYKLQLVLKPSNENVNTVISRAKVKEFKEWIKNG